MLTARTGVTLFVVAALGVGGVACRKMAESMAEKGMKAAKDTTKGLSEGLEKGRKEGQSADDAVVVTTAQDLKGFGSVTIAAVRAAREAKLGTEIELIVENTSDRPLRITNLDMLGLDAKGFVKRPASRPGELTVPAKAKDKLVVAFDGPEKLTKARLWGVDHDLPAPARSK